MKKRQSATLIPRLKARKSTRGAVLVEGIIVSSLLMTMMACGLFLHHLYVAQINALENARRAAWSESLRGCSSGIDIIGIWHQVGVGRSSSQLEVDTEVVPGFFGSVSHTSGSASATATAHERAGGASYTLSANDTVACNEVVQNPRGDALSLVGYISANVIPSFF